MFPAILTTLLWSGAIMCAHRSAKILGPARANLWRLALATVLLGVWAHGFGSGLSGAGLWWFVWSGFVGFGLGDVALYETLSRLGSRLTLLLTQCLAAMLGAVIEWVWLGTTLRGGEIAAGLVILGGVALAMAPKDHPHLSRRQWTVGVLCGVLGAMGQAGGAVLSRRAFQMAALAGQSVDGGTAAYQRIIGGVGVAALFLMWLRRRGEDGSDGLPNVGRRAWMWVVLNTLGGPVVGVSCYQWALATAPSGVVLAVVATTPLVVIPLAYKFEGDRPKARALVGGVIAVAGVAWLVAAR